MNSKNTISLNGDWKLYYLGSEPYNTTDLPTMDKAEPIKNAVPAYWEDMVEQLQMTKWFSAIRYNPLYTLQRYPMAGYAPDTCLPNPVGTFAYSKSFHVSAEAVNTDAVLYVGGAHNTVNAWINGVYIGRHCGYSSEFCIPLPQAILVAGENEIRLTVSNTRQGGYLERPVSGCTARAANECTGGIYGDVELRFVPDGLYSAFVRCDDDLNGFCVNLTGNVRSACTVTVFDGNKKIASKPLAAGASSVHFERGKMLLWSTKAPKRYRVLVESEHQSCELFFGLRRFTRKGTSLYLNGEPFYFRAICEHGYYPITVHPPRDVSYYRGVIKRIKELGFNAIRFHTWVPMAEYMEAADELGILIEVETPNNTTYDEWCDIVAFTKKYTSVVMYSSGNEMLIDEDYIEHLRTCAELVHRETDSLFSPMSAMRGVEYMLSGTIKEKPFRHNPERLATLSEFCDAYNSYSRKRTSYNSDEGNPSYLDQCNAVYDRPLLSHEICIHGTYIDLSLEERYRGTRIGNTELFSSVRRHLTQKGLVENAPLYYKNSAAWQQLSRKHCFEVCRRAESLAGYDFLGDIDHHWHTFGYCVGMMNEFYELKSGETVENVRRYNSDTVLLADLPRCRNFTAGEKLCVPLHVSNYGERIQKATLSVRIASESKVYLRREYRLSDIESGKLTEIAEVAFTLPRVEKPTHLKIAVSLNGGNTDADNLWDIYVYPAVKAKMPSAATLERERTVIADGMTRDELLAAVREKKKILLLSAEPFATSENSFQIAIAGRTEGHLATVIRDNALTRDLSHNGYCGWQFREMMNGSKAAILDLPHIPFAPIIEVATSYKNARREAMVFEYEIEGARLLVSTLNLKESDPAAMWLKAKLIERITDKAYAPALSLSVAELNALLDIPSVSAAKNANAAQNANDITMQAAKK